MPTAFDIRYAAHTFARLLVEYGEKIAVHPTDEPSRTISAIVDRNQLQPLPGIERAPVNSIRIHVLDHAVNGICRGAIDTGGYEVELAAIKGGPESRMRITKELDSAGHTSFEVE